MTTSTANDRFAGEEVGSGYGYPSGYQPRSIADQIARLRELFPGLGSANAQLANYYPVAGSGGYFAIPRWEKVAPTYNAAIEKVLAILSQARNGRFYNYREGELGPKRLRQHERLVTMGKELEDQETAHDILIVPAQFGLRHRGRSVRRTREMFRSTEFGLGAYEVGVMLLTHPERLQDRDDLWIDCAGDEYDDPRDDDRFSSAPYFGFESGRVRFGVRWGGLAHDRFGSATIIMP